MFPENQENVYFMRNNSINFNSYNVYNWFQNKKARLKARAQEEEKRRLGSLM